MMGKHAISLEQVEKAKNALLKKDPLLRSTIYNEEAKIKLSGSFDKIWKERWRKDTPRGKEYFQTAEKESPFEQYSSKGWKIHIAFEGGKEKEIAQFLHKNGLYFKVEAGSGTYFNGLKESGATIYIGSYNNMQEIAESIARNMGEFLRDGTIAKIEQGKEVKIVRVGSGSDIEILPKITARFDVAKTKYGWFRTEEQRKEREKLPPKLGPREYKYSEYGIASWSGLGGIPVLKKHEKEVANIEQNWNKFTPYQRQLYYEKRLKPIYDESKKELIKDFGAEFLLGKQK
jgi:hypothetical protein